MADSVHYTIPRRLRRLRRTPAVCALVAETALQASDLIMPLFVIDGDGAPEAIGALPGQYCYAIPDLLVEAEQLFLLGVGAIAIFPVIASRCKDAEGSEALREKTLLLRAVRAVKAAVPELVVIADVALDLYTDHGHDGVFNAQGSDIDNDATVARLAEMACLQAQAGVDFVAPSDMMDGRVQALREALDKAGFTETGILAYSAKFASACYGPFREAVGSASKRVSRLRDKQTYQLAPGNRRQALLEALLDEREGADILMVKPAGFYLDIIRDLREQTLLPVAAYQVSGEYAQIQAAAQAGWLDLENVREESLLAIKRAGADMIVTYFAKAWAKAAAHRTSCLKNGMEK